MKKKPKRDKQADKAHGMRLLRERGQVVGDMLLLQDESEDYQALAKRLADLNTEIERLGARI